MSNTNIITIGRQFGSGGREVGRRLAQQLGISFYDKELIMLASRQSGLCPEFFEKADERASSGLQQVIAAGYTYGGLQYNDFLSPERLFQIQSDVIRQLAEEESCVIVGRCADYILREHSCCTNLFVTAPMEARISNIMEREKLSKEDAADLARKMDKTRTNYYNFYTDKSWGVASSYHLCVDSSLLGVDKTVSYLKQFIGERLKS